MHSNPRPFFSSTNLWGFGLVPLLFTIFAFDEGTGAAEGYV